MITPELPPPISPRQMDILRAVTAMAWADGTLEPDEIRLMLDEFAVLFAKDEDSRQSLKNRLTEYLSQNVPLEEIIPNIKKVEDREMVLKLGYQVIQSSRRNPNEPMINVDEAAAYQRLVRMLELPVETVAKIERESNTEADNSNIDTAQSLASKLNKIMEKAD
ncbi:MAG: TerB family tellurite resistance protein [Pseudanabaenaceae cyanobacterium bins.39]|nr:TerB family tellurite resistance protein [Pseudanabaenaceae cyanobacterium bins.39]